jgi:2-amino-4-hydroxy-6-hydroxymethyldihydropteridine diphosphokinase
VWKLNAAVTNDLHTVYLNLGSNIQSDIYLPKAVDLLRRSCEVRACSSAWESHAVGSQGPDFLNACVLIATPLNSLELKNGIIEPVESALGRVRSRDKNAPRTIDIDTLMVDDEPLSLENWEYPFVVIPLAEIAPDLAHPISGEKISAVAARMRAQTWIRKRPEVLDPPVGLK